LATYLATHERAFFSATRHLPPPPLGRGAMGKKKRGHPGDPPADGASVMTTVARGLRAGLLLSARCLVPMFKKVADGGG